jgi:hypothetical protein
MEGRLMRDLSAADAMGDAISRQRETRRSGDGEERRVKSASFAMQGATHDEGKTTKENSSITNRKITQKVGFGNQSAKKSAFGLNMS